MSAMKRIETVHHTPEQIRQYLIDAQQLVADHVKAELRSPELLVKVLELVAAKSINEVHAMPQPVLLGEPRIDPRIGGGH